MHSMYSLLRPMCVTVAALVLICAPRIARAQEASPSAVAAADEPVVLAPERRPAVAVAAGQSRVIETPWPVKQIAVTNAEVADVQVLAPQRVQLQGKAIGTTDLTLSSEDGRVWRARVVVRSDLSDLEAQLQELFPRSALRVTQAGAVVVVSGTLARAEHAEQLGRFLTATEMKYVDATSVAGVQQVQLQVRLAEVSRTALQTLAANALYLNDDFFGGFPVGSSGGPFVPINIGVPAGTPAKSSLPFEFLAPVSVPTAATIFAGFPSADLEIFIQALQENQYMRILAEPTLVALSGSEANFLAGGEFPIPVVQGGTTGNAVSIEFKEFGVRLAFRPQVLGDGTIRLQVAPEVSELTDVGAVVIEGFRVPALVTRRVETTVELGSGQTFAMAGLINRTTSARASEIPGLGRIPVLGALFRSTRYTTGETELVVMVTASLAEPTSEASGLPLPGILHQPPNAWEFYAEGRIEGRSAPKLSVEDSEQLRRLGLNRLHGPGAWASYDAVPAATERGR